MDAIQHSIQAMTEHFNVQMVEFQKNLQSAIPATSPTSNIAAQFSAFRTFVLSALEGLQQQVAFLSKAVDGIEMHHRRKIILVHGIQENKKEDISAAVCSVLSSHLNIPGLKEDAIGQCHRLGKPKDDKPRAILLKFYDLALRNQVWFAKSSLKGTGVTLSEFLTKDRHSAFMAARQKFGIAKCWTRDGYVFIVSADGKRHRVTTISEVNSIALSVNTVQVPSTGATDSNTVSPSSSRAHVPLSMKPYDQPLRTRRTYKK